MTTYFVVRSPTGGTRGFVRILALSMSARVLESATLREPLPLDRTTTLPSSEGVTRSAIHPVPSSRASASDFLTPHL